MKNIVLTNNTASDLLSKISPFRSDKNKLLIHIGQRDLGTSLGCYATLINGGMQGTIGFTTSKPEDFSVEHPWRFITKANLFCSYLSGLLDYNQDICIASEGNAKISLSISGVARLFLPVAEEEEMDPLITEDIRFPLCEIKLKVSDFMQMLKQGAYLASNSSDDRCLTDRIAFSVKENLVYTYSTDITAVAKSWCPAEVKVAKAQRAILFLKGKEPSLSNSEKDEILQKMQACGKDAAKIIALAEAYGYDGSRFFVSLPTPAVTILKTILTSGENVTLRITNNNFWVASGNIQAVFALAGSVPGIYANTIDAWEEKNWTASIVVNKDSLIKALFIIKLGGKNNPCLFTVGNGSLKTTCDENEILTSLIASEGDISNIHLYLNPEKLGNILSKLSSGSVTLSFVTNKLLENPVKISNGDLKKHGNSISYLIPMRADDDSENTASDRTAS